MNGATWTPEQDAALRDGIERRKRSFSEVASDLGVTKGAAIGRYHRLIGAKYPSDDPVIKNARRNARRLIARAKKNLLQAGAR